MSETCTVLTISFLQSLKNGRSNGETCGKKSLELLRSGKALVHRLGLCSMNKDERSSQNAKQELVNTNFMQLTQKKSADSYKDNYGDKNWNFVKLINKVLLRWRNYENSRVLPSIRSQDGSSSRTRTLFWNLSGRVQELQNEVNCMNGSKDFQDAESVRSGNSHVTSRPVSFPPHKIPEGMLRHSFVSPSRKMGRQAFWTHMVYREKFLQIQSRLLQHLVLKN